MISLLRSSGLCWRFERFADDLLGAAEPVNRRRIDEIYPAVERRMDRLNRFMLVCPTPHPTADRPGSKRDARHLERRAGNRGKLHIDFENFGFAGHDTVPIARPHSVRHLLL